MYRLLSVLTLIVASAFAQSAFQYSYPSTVSAVTGSNGAGGSGSSSTTGSPAAVSSPASGGPINTATVSTSTTSPTNITSPNDNSAPPRCRCLDGDACFPNATAWNAFNQTIGGRLIVPHPTAYPCYPSSFDAQQCSAVQNFGSDGEFSETIAGSMAWINWEELGVERCPIELAKNASAVCHRGRVSTYSVNATSVADVQAAVLFAAQNNLRIFVKNTGHDYLGRSTSPGSLQIWLHNLYNITHNMNWTPDNCPGQAPIPTINVFGGPNWRQVYTYLHNKTNDQYVVVGGTCPSVGAAGGYFQGTGHSTLGPSFGLSVDSVVQIDVVTADGKFHVVNQCNEPDLFWALRGGGGGTYGIVTSVTYKLHPSPASFTSLKINVTPTPKGTILTSQQVRRVFRTLATLGQLMDDNRWGGGPGFEINAALGFGGVFLIPQHVSVANQSIQTFINKWKSDLGDMVTVSATISTPSGFYDYRFRDLDNDPQFNLYAGFNVDTVGIRVVVGSRLIPADALKDPITLGDTLWESAKYGDDFFGLLVAGRGTRELDNDQSQTSTTPAWRKAWLHCGYINGWDYNTDEKSVRESQSRLSSAIGVLRAAYPASGAYFGESFYEPQWKQTFWGNNYDRLLAVKHKYDPNGLFVCTQCVASDEWTDDGNCRI